MQTNSAILMQARSYNLQWKSSPPTKLKLLGVKRKRIVCVCVCVTQKDRLGLDHSWSKRTKKLWANRHGCSRQKRPGCLGGEENSGDVALWRIWEAGAVHLAEGTSLRLHQFPPVTTSQVADQLHLLQQPQNKVSLHLPRRGNSRPISLSFNCF